MIPHMGCFVQEDWLSPFAPQTAGERSAALRSPAWEEIVQIRSQRILLFARLQVVFATHRIDNGHPENEQADRRFLDASP